MSYGELLFGNIAIQFRYATQAQIQEALEKQEGVYSDLPLGEILMQLGYLTGDQRDELVETQSNSKAKPANTKFGKLVVINGFVSQKNILNAIDTQKAYLKKTGKLPPLGKILTKQKLITPQEKNAIISLQHRVSNKSPIPSGVFEDDLLEIDERLDEDKEVLTKADFKIRNDERDCTTCGAIIFQTLTFCPHCKTYFCKFCAGQLDPDNRFCLDCGKFVEGQSPKFYRKQVRHSATATSVTYILLVLALVFGGFLLRSIFVKEALPEKIRVNRDGDLDSMEYEIQDLIEEKKFDAAEAKLSRFRRNLAGKDLTSATFALYEDTADNLSSSINEKRKEQEKKEKDPQKKEVATKEPVKGETTSRVYTTEEILRNTKNLIDLKKYKKAATALAELNSRPDRSWYSFYLAGEVAMKQEKFDVAIHFFEKSREMGGKEFPEKNLQEIYQKLLPLYNPIKDHQRIIHFLTTLKEKNTEQKKLLSFAYWYSGQREKAWEILYNLQGEPDLLVQVLLAEYAMVKKKPDLIKSVLQMVTQEMKTTFVDLYLWKKWYELCTSTDKFYEVTLKSGKKYFGKLVEDKRNRIKLQTGEGKKVTLSRSQMSKEKEVPNPDLVQLEKFIQERAAIPFDEMNQYMKLAKKYLSSELIKPFAIALLVRFEDEKPDAFEFIREQGFQVDEGAFIHNSLMELKRAFDFSRQRPSQETVEKVTKVLELFPEDPHLLYFQAVILVCTRKNKEAQEISALIPNNAGIKKLGDLRKQIDYQVRAYCGTCQAKGERCGTCNKHGSTFTKCHVCKGTRQHPKKRKAACPHCLGAGTIKSKCETCRGVGFVTCSNCGTKPGEPLPQYGIKRAEYFVEEALAQFMQKSKIVGGLVFPKTTFKY